MRNRLLRPGAYLFESQRRTALLHDDGSGDFLCRIRNGNPHDGNVVDRRMTANRGFHLGWVDVETAGQNEFLFAVRHRNEPVAVHADVAGLEPALRRKDACGLFGCIQISFEDLRSTNDNLPRLAILDVESIVVERDEA